LLPSAASCEATSGSLGFSGQSGNLPAKSFLPVLHANVPVFAEWIEMRNYVDTCVAFGECLERQVRLGARIVAATGTLLADQSVSEMRKSIARLRELRNEARKGNVELTKLRRAVKRSRASIA
jgi:hypothetical protein